MNHYDTLEVSPQASAEVIRAAYKSLMQRYHPDKNPGDAAIAARALAVVQAYEVLSDAVRRAEYDRSLQRARADAAELHFRRAPLRPEPAARKGGLFRYALLLLAVIIGSGWAIVSMGKKRPAAEEPASAYDAPLPAAGAKAGKTGRSESAAEREPAKAAVVREIPLFAEKLTISLRAPGRPERVLLIPVVGLRVGPRDAENAVRHLNNTREQIVSRLPDLLAASSVDALIRPDGEDYLAAQLLQAVTELSGMAPPEAATAEAADPAARYGVVEVLLPQSFALR